MKQIVIAMVMLLVGVAAECGAVDFTFSETLASDYFTKSGSRTGKGPVAQSMMNISSWGFYTTLWNNYDFRLKKATENDITLGKKFITENSFGTFSADFSYIRQLLENSNENLLEANFKYKGFVTGSFIWTKLITEGFKSDHNRYHLELAKPIPIGKLTITPSVTAAYLDHFYNGSRGWAHVTARLKSEYEVSKHISIFAQINRQKGIMKNKESLFYGGGGIRYSF